MTSEPTIEQQAEDLADQTMLRSLDVGPRGITLDLAPPHDLVLSMVETAKKVLGDAPNYTETPVTLTVSAAGEVEHYAFTVQRVGNITPHQAREKAEAEAGRLRATVERLIAELAELDSQNSQTEVNFDTYVESAILRENDLRERAATAEAERDRLLAELATVRELAEPMDDGLRLATSCVECMDRPASPGSDFCPDCKGLFAAESSSPTEEKG